MSTSIITANSDIVTIEPISEDLLQRYIDFIDSADKTIETYKKALRQMFVYFYDNGITQPTRADIIAYRDYLKADHKPNTVQLYITSVRMFFTWTAAEHIYPNIAEHIKGAKIDREHKKDYLTSKQVRAVLNSIDRSTATGLRDYAIMYLMVTAGLRTIEVSRANIEDIRTVGDNTVLFVQGKGHEEKADYIKLSDKAEQAIREYLKTRKNITGADALFTSTSHNNAGQRMTTRSISGIVKARLKAVGYDSDRLTAHSLRHTAVTLSLTAGKDITEVQQFARHANINTTMIYAHLLDKAQNTCSDAIADLIG